MVGKGGGVPGLVRVPEVRLELTASVENGAWSSRAVFLRVGWDGVVVIPDPVAGVFALVPARTCRRESGSQRGI